ncbi:MAG: hemerythrin domain-containing protein [Acidimicrobiales bacterium]
MADATKVLINDHQRLRRMLKQFNWGTYNQAMAICDEFIIQATTNDELVYPAVRDQIDGRLADRAEEGQDHLKGLMGDICELEADDANLDMTVTRFKEAAFRHMDFEERDIYPKINSVYHDTLYEMGNQLWALRQELLQVKPIRTERAQPLTGNTGWGKQMMAREKSLTSSLGW